MENADVIKRIQEEIETMESIEKDLLEEVNRVMEYNSKDYSKLSDLYSKLHTLQYSIFGLEEMLNPNAYN